jgi:PAS domain S-box-containing protein
MVVIISTLVTYYFGNRVLEAHARAERHRETIRRLDELVSSLKDAETGQRGFIITGDENYLDPYKKASRRLPELMDALDSIPGVNRIVAEKIRGLVARKTAELQSTVDARRANGFEAAAEIVRSGQGRQTMDELRLQADQLKSTEELELERDLRLSDETTRTRTLVFVVTGCFNIAFLAWAFFRVADSMRQRDSALEAAHDRGRELQRQKDLLRVTLSSIGDCVIVTDEEGRINFMNRVAENVTGWTFAEARSRPAGEIFHILNEQSREPVASPVEKVMRDGAVVGLANHTLLVRKDGSEVPIDDSGAPIRDEDGKLRGVVLVFRDFSEHRRNEKDLRTAKEEAETANKAKDRFLAMLSHELRTPLTPVLATLNLWEASEDIPPILQDDVQMLRRSVELEARIIDDLLDLTRVARGMLSFSPENTDVHGLIEFLMGISQSELQEKQLKLVLRLEAKQHHIHTDAARLQQVLWNILRNAIKFTDSKGEITLATFNSEDGKISIAVSDTGIGMTRETISRLFRPFEQADSTRSSRYGGLGLGMAISSALVELLDGTLVAQSAGLGRGSIFTVTFATTEPVDHVRSGEVVAPVRGKTRLLLIEDHADTARALTRLLESRGYEIHSANSVAAGLKAVQEQKFDLFLCDLGLPDGTGFDFIAKARAIVDTPAIALTGFGMQQDVERAQQAGFAAHLTKPVNLQKLESSIWTTLQGAG